MKMWMFLIYFGRSSIRRLIYRWFQRDSKPETVIGINDRQSNDDLNVPFLLFLPLVRENRFSFWFMAGRERQRGINWAPSLENDPNINPALILRARLCNRWWHVHEEFSLMKSDKVAMKIPRAVIFNSAPSQRKQTTRWWWLLLLFSILSHSCGEGESE